MHFATTKDWSDEGVRLFGKDKMNWKFACPICNSVMSVRDYKDAGAPENAVGFSCIGRYMNKRRDAFTDDGPGPCNYAGGGLFKLNPVLIGDSPGSLLFNFAGADKG